MNIVLIGYRGTGKSTVARLLGEQLKRDVVSTDAEIVARLQQSIPDIITRHGWDYFRDVESQICREVTAKDDQVIDTGGGIILRPANVEALRATGRIFWLTADVPTIAQRIGGDTQRPSLTGTKSFVDEIAEVLADRRPHYEAAAHHVIATDGRSVSAIAEAITALLPGRRG